MSERPPLAGAGPGPPATGYEPAFSILAARAIQKLTPRIISVTTVMVMVASTLISGLTPKRTFENTTIGSVLEPGPEVKLEITRSSQDSVNAKSQPDRMAGKMIGSVIKKNTFTGRAPRSMAASSSAVSKVAMRDCTTTVTYAMEKVMCPMVMVVMPRPAGHPIDCSKATNSRSSDKPVITSGITSGAVVMALSVNRPRNWEKRARPNPASVPRITEPDAFITATFSEIHAASRISSLWSSEEYHLRVGEFAESHTVTNFDALNENTTMERMGMYRNANPNARQVRMKYERR